MRPQLIDFNEQVGHVKYSIFSGVDLFGTPRVHLIEPGSRYGLRESASLDKTASGEHLPEVIELVESIAPQPGRLYLVNSSLAAGEFVGYNKRGDWFTEAGLRKTPPGWDDIPIWDLERRRQAANYAEYVPGYGMCAWGFPTFYNAHRYKHHVNKDPNKAYGFTLGAFWDDRMKRVILVTELVEEMCRRNGGMDVYDRIQSGHFPDTSMGSKVPYDRCSICQHKAATPAQYCEHVKKGASAPYGMNSLLPDGRRCGVLNDQPRFFDDSFVFRGAEKSAKVLANVTDMVKGANAYSQKIFPFVTPRYKQASFPSPESTLSIPENHGKINKDHIPEGVYHTKLMDTASHISAGSSVERAALAYFVDKHIKLESLQRGRLPKADYDMWDVQAKNSFIMQYGVPVDTFKHLEEQLTHAHNDIFTSTKTAHWKWAEMIKRIDINPEALSSVRSQTEGCHPIPPSVLDYIAGYPHRHLRGLLSLGIVAKPEEFQYIMLSQRDPSIARKLFERGVVFGPRPMSDTVPIFPPDSIDPDLLDMMRDFIGSRSFAPKAVKSRMIKRSKTPKRNEKQARELPREVTYPVLDEVGDAYNKYRLGILAAEPNFDNEHLQETSFTSNLEKDAQITVASSDVSKLLLSTSYWSSVSNYPLTDEGQ